MSFFAFFKQKWPFSDRFWPFLTIFGLFFAFLAYFRRFQTSHCSNGILYA